MDNSLGKVKKVHFKNRLTKALKAQYEFVKNGGIRRNLNVRGFKKVKERSSVLFLILVSLVFVGAYSFLSTFNHNVEYAVTRSSMQTFTDLQDSYNFSEAKVLGQATDISKREDKVLRSELKSQDKRIFVLDEYFRQRNSPLYGHARVFVQACDKYGAPRDCIATTAIARHETDLCKYSVSAQMHNCMGWGGAGVNRMRFDSFEQHLDVATRVLVQSYGPEMMIDPRLMETVFCGPQDECINWGNRVLVFVEEIDRFAESLGVGRLTLLR